MYEAGALTINISVMCIFFRSMSGARPGGVVEHGALSVKWVGVRSAHFSYLYVGARSADAKRSKCGALIQKKVGARSGDVKNGRSAERFLPPDGPH